MFNKKAIVRLSVRIKGELLPSPVCRESSKSGCRESARCEEHVVRLGFVPAVQRVTKQMVLYRQPEESFCPPFCYVISIISCIVSYLSLFVLQFAEIAMYSVPLISRTAITHLPARSVVPVFSPIACGR